MLGGALVGDGKFLTQMRRTANSNFINMITAPNGEVRDLSIDMARSVNGFNGHGIAGTQSYTTVSNVAVKDFGSTSDAGGTGICLYADSYTPKLMRISNCDLYGNAAIMAAPGGQSYGWLMADIQTSFVDNVYAFQQRNYGHELKNRAYYCALSNLIAEKTGTALGYGQDSGAGPCYNVATGIVSKASDCGFTVGIGDYNVVSGLMHDNTNAPGISGTSHVARFENSNSNALFGALGVGSYVNTIRYGGNQNYAQVSSQDTSSILVNIVAGARKNATEIAHPGARTTILNAIGDTSGFGLRTTNANPIWCHATGERIGSISGKFYDKLGFSGASPNPNHQWVKESDQYAIQSYMTPGNSGDSVGMAYAIAGNTNYAAVTYQKAAAADQEYWAFESQMLALCGSTRLLLVPKATTRWISERHLPG
ncbi:hypothetical protein WJ972_15550 [Achromobacter insuavis]